MKTCKIMNTLIFCLITAGLTVDAQAGKNSGKGGGKDGNPGGSGYDTPDPISLTITFTDDELNFGIQSDEAAYVDDHPDAAYPLDAHIDGNAGGNYGNLYLRTDFSLDRSVRIDIEKGCVEGCDNQPFSTRSFHLMGLKVAATESVSGGFCGMETGVDNAITAPMQLAYYDPQAFDTSAPGFIDFFPVTKGKSPCKGSAASEVRVIRESDRSWLVRGEAACIRWPGGREFGGVAYIPFEFKAESVEACQ